MEDSRLPQGVFRLSPVGSFLEIRKDEGCVAPGPDADQEFVVCRVVVVLVGEVLADLHLRGGEASCHDGTGGGAGAFRTRRSSLGGRLGGVTMYQFAACPM